MYDERETQAVKMTEGEVVFFVFFTRHLNTSSSLQATITLQYVTLRCFTQTRYTSSLLLCCVVLYSLPSQVHLIQNLEISGTGYLQAVCPAFLICDCSVMHVFDAVTTLLPTIGRLLCVVSLLIIVITAMLTVATVKYTCSVLLIYTFEFRSTAHLQTRE